jgi:hypothetical protein
MDGGQSRMNVGILSAQVGLFSSCRSMAPLEQICFGHNQGSLARLRPFPLAGDD